jgi:hypothetical protein
MLRGRYLGCESSIQMKRGKSHWWMLLKFP